MVSAFNSVSSGQDSSSGRERCVVSLEESLFSYSASQPGVKMATVEFDDVGDNPGID